MDYTWIKRLQDMLLRTLYQQTRLMWDSHDSADPQDDLGGTYEEFCALRDAVFEETWQRFARPVLSGWTNRDWLTEPTCPGPHRLVVLPFASYQRGGSEQPHARCTHGTEVKICSYTSSVHENCNRLVELLDEATAAASTSKYTNCACGGTVTNNDFRLIRVDFLYNLVCVWCARQRPAY